MSRALKRPAMPGAGRPSRGNAKRVLVLLTPDELAALERLQVARKETASEVLRAGLAALATPA